MPPWKAEGGLRRICPMTVISPPNKLRPIQEWAKSGEPEGDAVDLPANTKIFRRLDAGHAGRRSGPDEDYTLAAGRRGSLSLFCHSNKTHRRSLHQRLGGAARQSESGASRHCAFRHDGTGRASWTRRIQAPAILSFGGVGFKSGGMIGGWAPGNYTEFFCLTAWPVLPKNADLVVQVHYHRSGKVETDRTKSGPVFFQRAGR